MEILYRRIQLASRQEQVEQVTSPAERIIREYGEKVADIVIAECVEDCQFQVDGTLQVCPEHMHFVDLITTTPIL